MPVVPLLQEVREFTAAGLALVCGLWIDLTLTLTLTLPLTRNLTIPEPEPER